MNFAISFITSFIIKWFTGPAIESIVLILLKKLVETTSSKIDDDIYNVVFAKIKNKEENNV